METTHELTADTITDDQIEALKVAAGEHGDDDLADICRLALRITSHVAWTLTPYAARARCAEVINDTRAATRMVARDPEALDFIDGDDDESERDAYVAAARARAQEG